MKSGKSFIFKLNPFLKLLSLIFLSLIISFCSYKPFLLIIAIFLLFEIIASKVKIQDYLVMLLKWTSLYIIFLIILLIFNVQAIWTVVIYKLILINSLIIVFFLTTDFKGQVLGITKIISLINLLNFKINSLYIFIYKLIIYNKIFKEEQKMLNPKLSVYNQKMSLIVKRSYLKSLTKSKVNTLFIEMREKNILSNAELGKIRLEKLTVNDMFFIGLNLILIIFYIVRIKR